MKSIALLVVVCALAAATSGCSKDSPQATTATAATGTAATAAGGDTATGELVVGKPAPDFSVKASDGTVLKLSELKGKPIVVYFYPKDETPGCTKEACAFRDSFEQLKKQGVVLIGVSADSDESHREFAEHHKLPFYLVADEKLDLAKKFGVETTMGFIKRQSIVIGPDGNVKKIYRTVDVTTHAQQIMDDVKTT